MKKEDIIVPDSTNYGMTTPIQSEKAKDVFLLLSGLDYKDACRVLNITEILLTDYAKIP